MAATFAPRRVPLLALLPRAEREEDKNPEAKRVKPARSAARSPVRHTEAERPAAPRGTDESVEDGGGDGDDREDEERRLGERFLRAMAQLARLARAPLDGQGGAQEPPKRQPSDAPAASRPPTSPAQRSRSPSGATAAASLKAGTGGSPMRANLVVVNAATAPLREHLTFEVSMLLPAPIDARQSALQSPIRRKRRRRRRRKRRLRREWRASATTWVPHMASDYAEAREASAWHNNLEFQLAQQMQQLDLRRAAGPSAVARSVSLPQLALREPLVATDTTGSDSDSEGESESEMEDEDEQGEQDEDEQDEGEQAEGAGATDSDGEPRASSAFPRGSSTPPAGEPLVAQAAGGARKAPTPAAEPPTTRRALRHHRPAWITPELRAWLVASGLFTTTSSTWKP